VLQFTPPGSGCSIIFGENATAAAPGTAQGLYLIVSDKASGVIESDLLVVGSPDCRQLSYWIVEGVAG
jgi:hypothetical protein